MSNASTRLETRAKPRIERLQPWIAALLDVLLHLLLVLVLLSASKPTMTTPQGAASGGRMKVDFVGETRRPVQAPPSPTPPRKHASVRKPPAASPIQATLVTRADDPVPPDAPVQQPNVPQPAPPDVLDDAWTQTPATNPPPPTERRPETWTGRPPGMLEQDVAPDDEGLANSRAISRGNGRDPDANGPSLEVGGYLVYYDLRSETQLRAWIAQGMKELFIILPGTRYRMACSLDIALKRGSGKCRLLDPNAPDTQAIGDAREVINMMQVYHRGELVWRGPGPYR